MGCTFTGTALMGTKIYEELFPNPADSEIEEANLSV